MNDAAADPSRTQAADVARLLLALELRRLRGNGMTIGPALVDELARRLAAPSYIPDMTPRLARTLCEEHLAILAAQGGQPGYEQSSIAAHRETVEIPLGRNLRLRQPVSRYWFHNPFSRGMAAPPLGIAGYDLPRAEQELAKDFHQLEGQGVSTLGHEKFVYLAPMPLGALEYNVVVDIGPYADNVRLTGQSEGYAVLRGDVLADDLAWVGPDLRAGAWRQWPRMAPTAMPAGSHRTWHDAHRGVSCSAAAGNSDGAGAPSTRRRWLKPAGSSAPSRGSSPVDGKSSALAAQGTSGSAIAVPDEILIVVGPRDLLSAASAPTLENLAWLLDECRDRIVVLDGGTGADLGIVAGAPRPVRDLARALSAARNDGRAVWFEGVDNDGGYAMRHALQVTLAFAEEGKVFRITGAWRDGAVATVANHLARAGRAAVIDSTSPAEDDDFAESTCLGDEDFAALQPGHRTAAQCLGAEDVESGESTNQGEAASPQWTRERIEG